MRILVVSNLYPPHAIGGYETGCQAVVEGLIARGHAVQVLTSVYGSGADNATPGILRLLPESLTRFLNKPSNPASNRSDAWKPLREELESQRVFLRCLRRFEPDVVYFWNLKWISMSLPLIAAARNIPHFFYVSDEWMADRSSNLSDKWDEFWNRTSQSLLKQTAKRVLGCNLRQFGCVTRSAVPYEGHVQFTSEFIRQQALNCGCQPSSSSVIHWGVDTSQFFPMQGNASSSTNRPHAVLKLLFLGQLMPHKGPDTAILALDELRRKHDCRHISLTLAGGTVNEAFKLRLIEMIRELRLEDVVTVTGPIPRDRVADTLRDHDVYLFPSVWQEPFSIALLEAMASGLAVVGTLTGGTSEVLNPEVNGLSFTAGNPAECAEQISRLANDPKLRRKLGANAREKVMTLFSLETMIGKIEAELSSRS